MVILDPDDIAFAVTENDPVVALNEALREDSRTAPIAVPVGVVVWLASPLATSLAGDGPPGHPQHRAEALRATIRAGPFPWALFSEEIPQRRRRWPGNRSVSRFAGPGIRALPVRGSLPRTHAVDCAEHPVVTTPNSGMRFPAQTGNETTWPPARATHATTARHWGRQRSSEHSDDSTSSQQ